jgi:hypothetical protein
MGFIQDQIDYLNDNPKGYWFKRKLYGWGWTPAKWQGWLVIAAFIAFIIWDFMRLKASFPLEIDALTPWSMHTLIAVIILIVICYSKGESLKWQWVEPGEGPERKDGV